jgi:hypothetical protein
VKQRQIRLLLGQYRKAVADGSQDGHTRAPAIAIAGSEQRSLPHNLDRGHTSRQLTLYGLGKAGIYCYP